MCFANITRTPDVAISAGEQIKTEFDFHVFIFRDYMDIIIGECRIEQN